MNNTLLHKICSIEDFIIEQAVIVDNAPVVIRPLYVERISLFPDIFDELAQEISISLSSYSPEVIYTIEASILPLAAVVANKMKIPLSVIRKQNLYEREINEPKYFINSRLKSVPAVLFDDALYSGNTLNHALTLLKCNGISLPQCYFLFDFYEFANGGSRLCKDYISLVQSRACWVSYKELLLFLYDNNSISDIAFQKSMALFRDKGK